MKDWWNSLDMTDEYLCKIFSGMFGTVEQRIAQLYIVKDNLNFNKDLTKKKKK